MELGAPYRATFKDQIVLVIQISSQVFLLAPSQYFSNNSIRYRTALQRVVGLTSSDLRYLLAPDNFNGHFETIFSFVNRIVIMLSYDKGH